MFHPVASTFNPARSFDFFEDGNDDIVYEIFCRKIKNLEWADVASLRRTCKKFDQIGDFALRGMIYNKKTSERVYLKGITALRGFLRLCFHDKNSLSFDVEFQKRALQTVLDAKHPEALFELVRLPGFVPIRDGFNALQTACNIGSVKAVCHLLQDDRIDPAVNNNLAFQRACLYGYKEVVQLLLDDGRADPATYNNWPVQWASKSGHKEVVQLLLDDIRVDPAADNNLAIRWASQSGHKEIVQLLLGDERVSSAAKENIPIQ